jgi:hypothetical protein
MTIYAQTWCPGDPCDPCGCHIQPADFETFRSLTQVNYDLGTIPLCQQRFIWPFKRWSGVHDSLVGLDAPSYYPIGMRFRGFNSPGGVPQPSSEQVSFSYLGTIIFSSQVTHTLSASPYQQIVASPAPTATFKVLYSDALGLANQAGLTIQQYFGDYQQDDPINNSPIILQGFVYTGNIDNTVNKTLSISCTTLSGPLADAGFLTHPQEIWYGGVPVLLKRSQLGHQLPLVARFQGY